MKDVPVLAIALVHPIVKLVAELLAGRPVAASTCNASQQVRSLFGAGRDKRGGGIKRKRNAYNARGPSRYVPLSKGGDLSGIEFILPFLISNGIESFEKMRRSFLRKLNCKIISIRRLIISVGRVI